MLTPGLLLARSRGLPALREQLLGFYEYLSRGCSRGGT